MYTKVMMCRPRTWAIYLYFLLSYDCSTCINLFLHKYDLELQEYLWTLYVIHMKLQYFLLWMFFHCLVLPRYTGSQRGKTAKFCTRQWGKNKRKNSFGIPAAWNCRSCALNVINVIACHGTKIIITIKFFVQVYILYGCK